MVAACRQTCILSISLSIELGTRKGEKKSSPKESQPRERTQQKECFATEKKQSLASRLMTEFNQAPNFQVVLPSLLINALT